MTEQHPAERQHLAAVSRDEKKMVYLTHYFDIEWPGGGHWLGIDDGDYEQAVADPVRYVEKQLGVPWEVYCKFVEWQGYWQCAGMTKHGHRCRKTVGAYHGDDVRAWWRAEIQGRYCKIHQPETDEV